MSRINLYYQPLLEQLAHIKQADESVCSAVEAEGVSNWDEPLRSASLIKQPTKALFSSHSKNVSKQLSHKMAWNNLFSMATGISTKTQLVWVSKITLNVKYLFTLINYIKTKINIKISDKNILPSIHSQWMKSSSSLHFFLIQHLPRNMSQYGSKMDCSNSRWH